MQPGYHALSDAFDTSERRWREKPDSLNLLKDFVTAGLRMAKYSADVGRVSDALVTCEHMAIVLIPIVKNNSSEITKVAAEGLIEFAEMLADRRKLAVAVECCEATIEALESERALNPKFSSNTLLL